MWKGLTQDPGVERSLSGLSYDVGNKLDWEMFAVRSRYRLAMPLDTMLGTRVGDVKFVVDLALEDIQGVVGEGKLGLTKEETEGIRNLRVGEMRQPNIDSFYAKEDEYVCACEKDMRKGLEGTDSNPEMLEVKKTMVEEMSLAVGMGRVQVGEIRSQIFKPLDRLRTRLEANGFRAENGRVRLGVQTDDNGRLHMAVTDYFYKHKGEKVVGWEDIVLIAIECGLRYLTDVTTLAEEAQNALQIGNPKVGGVMQKMATIFGEGFSRASEVLKWSKK